MTDPYTVHVYCQRWRWYPSLLPFGRVWLHHKKETTREAAFEMCARLMVEGAERVILDTPTGAIIWP